MFWGMALLGGALLAPCLILPAWLEYEASLDLKALREYQIAAQEAEITKLCQQREHLETDDAYVLRLARRELNIETPGMERIDVAPGEMETGNAGPRALPADDDELTPELSAMVEEIMLRYPRTQVFVHGATRPALMIVGGGLLLTAIVLLGKPSSHRAAAGKAA